MDAEVLEFLRTVESILPLSLQGLDLPDFEERSCLYAPPPPHSPPPPFVPPSVPAAAFWVEEQPTPIKPRAVTKSEADKEKEEQEESEDAPTNQKQKLQVTGGGGCGGGGEGKCLVKKQQLPATLCRGQITVVVHHKQRVVVSAKDQAFARKRKRMRRFTLQGGNVVKLDGVLLNAPFVHPNDLFGSHEQQQLLQ